MPVIDEQGRPALCDQPTRHFINNRGRARTGLDDRPFRSLATILGNRRIHRPVAGHRHETVILQSHHPLAPSAFGSHHLANRQGIEELVGNQQHRAFGRHAGKVGMPDRFGH